MLLDARTRMLLRASAPLNVFGALVLAPPFPYARRLAGLPEGHAIWLWMLSIWVLSFGVAYWRVGTSGVAERNFLGVAAIGKASFSLVLVAAAVAGEVPWLAAVAASPDLVLAVFFADWLRRNPA
jgi:hypothetical protein